MGVGLREGPSISKGVNLANIAHKGRKWRMWTEDTYNEKDTSSKM